MELRQLTYLIATIRTGSISRAAATLGIGQSVLSRVLRQLEQELGVTLLYRHGRGVEPTQEGAQFIAAVEPLVAGIERAAAEARDGAAIPAGEVRLGLPPSFTAAIGVPLVRAVMAQLPQVRLHMLDAFSGFVSEWLADGRVDLVVLNSAIRASQVLVDPLLTVNLFLLGRQDLMDRLAPGGERFATTGLGRLPLLLPGPHHGLRRELESLSQRLGIVLQPVLEIDSMTVLKELVWAGIGIAVLPHGAILAESQNPAFAIRRLVDPDATQTFVVAYPRKRPMALATREVARLLKDQVRLALTAGSLVGRLAEPESSV